MPTLLDFYCGAGGVSVGYYDAGFDVVGVDINPQPNYPFEFILMDAFEALRKYGHLFDVFHASPPCQKYTRMNQGLLQSQGRSKNYPDLIPPTRKALIKTGKPYIIEGVVGSPLNDPFLLCGSMFNLLVRRHRLFEANFFILTMQCQHEKEKPIFPPLHRHNKGHSSVVGCYGRGGVAGDKKALWQKAMEITWMTRPEMAQAIPPAYTEWIGKQLIQQVR